jgi:hypothetical protein
LVLFDKFGIAIDAKFVEKEEVISIGNEVRFPCYCAVVGSKVSGIQEKQQKDCSLDFFGITLTTVVSLDISGLLCWYT